MNTDNIFVILILKIWSIAQTKQENSKADDIINIALIGVSLAMGICIVVTSVLKQIDMNSAITMLGIGLSCLSIYLLKNKKDNQ